MTLKLPHYENQGNQGNQGIQGNQGNQGIHGNQDNKGNRRNRDNQGNQVNQDNKGNQGNLNYHESKLYISFIYHHSLMVLFCLTALKYPFFQRVLKRTCKA